MSQPQDNEQDFGYDLEDFLLAYEKHKNDKQHPTPLAVELMAMQASIIAEVESHYESLLNQSRNDQKIGWANKFIKVKALPEGDEGPEFARGWNAYRNKCLSEKAKLQKAMKAKDHAE